jgi:Flp pilus assembly protein TadG
MEVALCSFLLFLVFSGIFRFGYSFYAYGQLVSAVRNGARYASNHGYASGTTTPDAAFLADVKNMVVFGSPAPLSSAQAVAKGLSTANVKIDVTAGSAGAIQTPVEITVSIQNFDLDAVFAVFRMDGRPFATFPYTGILSPP